MCLLYLSTMEKEQKRTKKKDLKLVRKIKQNIYKWHRLLGIITVVPVLFWCLSGVMHPFMSHFFKPEIANDRLKSEPINPSQLKWSLEAVLQYHKIESFKNAHLVAFNNKQYYQIKTLDKGWLYFDSATGEPLTNGDAQYAEWLSRYFLDDQKSKVTSVEVITTFDSQYKYVNRYLPVYKLTFDRPDGMEIYVETSSSKLATFNPKSRQFFIWFFDVFHNWSFVDAIANNGIRIGLMILLLTIISLSALSGIIIYGFFWKQFKRAPAPTDQPSKFRRHHRKIGITTAFITLTFAFSGAYHALRKLEPNIVHELVYEPAILTQNLKVSLQKVFGKDEKIKQIGLITYNDSIYYQIQKSAGPKKSKTEYYNAQSGKMNSKTEMDYAHYLANHFSGIVSQAKPCCEAGSDEKSSYESITEAKILETKTLFEFDKREYGFVNKRLPVVKLAYDTPNKTTYYLEMSTSRIAAIVTNSDRAEGYSFAILHKFLFMDWAGKTVRDWTTIISAMGLLVVSLLGLYLFLKST